MTMSQPGTAPAYSEGFEGGAPLAGADVRGAVTISHTDPHRGTSCLVVQRSREAMERTPAAVLLPMFAARDGMWDVTVALRAKLHSPDSSYNGTVRLEMLDAAGEVKERDEIAIITGDRGWTPFRKRIELPDGITAARFTITMEKTWGEFAVDDLTATFVGPSLRTVSAIAVASEAVGNLFLPEQPLRFTVSARCRRARATSERMVLCTVRDYWGAEFGTRRVALEREISDERGRPVYEGVLDLAGLPIEGGKYYEIHCEMNEPALPEPTVDTSAFAVLPVAITKNYPPFDVPFTASGWNPGVPGFFPLCDRLGLRVANVYSRWSAEPPYQWIAPGIEIVKELGMGALLSTPVHQVEIRGKGYERYDETALREGARGLVNAFKDQLPIALRVGNEPHPVDDDDVRRMIGIYRAVYEGAKAADPSIIVTATSCGPEEAFFRLGYQDTHDVYIFHQYADAQVIHGDFARYERLVERYGKRKPIWSTELGLNSQGMSRSAVAIQLIKIFTNFFVCGGENASWFGIMWPDPDARLVGTNGDSFDIFNSKYCCYSPKLTAVAEYHFVNALCVKKVVAQRTYADGESLTLFRDADHRCLVVAWNDAARRAVRLPLPEGATVRATRLDGAGSAFTVRDGLTLSLSDEPYLLEFVSADFVLPETLQIPAAALDGEPMAVVKGGAARVAVRCPACAASGVTIEAPPEWAVRSVTAPPGLAVFEVAAPAATAARSGRLLVRLGPDVGELLVPVTVEDALAVRFVPAPLTTAGAGMMVELRNRGPIPQRVQWSVSVPETHTMAKGSFALKQPEPFAPMFTTPHTGVTELASNTSATIAVRASNLDPLALYRARLELTAVGRTVSHERLFGGCVGVPKVASSVVFDGRMGDPAWAGAAMVRLDQPGQFAPINAKTARWDGPDDLSATMHFLWDYRYLYLGLRVRDDVFCQPEVDANLWRGDGLQFLVDPCRDSSEKPGKYDYGVALTAKGVQAWCYASADAARAPSEEVTDFVLKITPTGSRGDMIYELAIPWHRVSPFVPTPGGNLGLAMIINNDDGRIRDSFMAWFGCAHSKQLSMNGDLILLDGPAV